MITQGEDDLKDVAKIFLECDCGHGIIEIAQFQSDGMVFIGYKECGWSINQRPVRNSIKRFFENLWKLITGQEYVHYSILLQGYEVKALKNAINSLKEVGENGLD